MLNIPFFEGNLLSYSYSYVEMSLGQAIVLQAAVVLVAVDVGLIHQRFSSAAQLPADVCPDWRQTICSLCSSSNSVDAENRCCLEDLTYGLCVERLVKANSASPRGLDSRISSSQNKRAKFFLGKRVKYFLGKRGNGLAPSLLPSDASEELSGLYRNQIREEEKRAKYFLGK